MNVHFCLLYIYSLTHIGTTYLIQPLDVVVNGPFKKLVEEQSCQHLQENLDSYMNGKVNYFMSL